VLAEWRRSPQQGTKLRSKENHAVLAIKTKQNKTTHSYRASCGHRCHVGFPSFWKLGPPGPGDITSHRPHPGYPGWSGTVPSTKRMPDASELKRSSVLSCSHPQAQVSACLCSGLPAGSRGSFVLHLHLLLAEATSEPSLGFHDLDTCFEED